jgi:Ca-activated chloride channel family protein
MSPSHASTRFVINALAVLGLLAPGIETRGAAVSDKPDIQSPYFEVKDDSGDDHFPMKETRVTVEINGVIASVHVHQHYRNEGKTPINARYIFPGSTRAAVNGMVMTVGNRRIKAQIREKEVAHKIFEAAKAAGKTASLLTQKRPNVFSMDVANIGAGDEVIVEMDYTEFLTANEGVYEFVYPGVVGPRYGGDADRTTQETKWVSNPYLHAGTQTAVSFDMRVELNSSIAINELSSTTHQLTTTWKGTRSAVVGLNESRLEAGNRDFILRYRLQDNAIVSGLTRFSMGGENFFMLQAEPPRRVTGADLPPRDYVFIVDVSGSMFGFPLNTARSLIEKLLANLQSKDSFNIIFFSGGSTTLAPDSLPATPENIARAKLMMQSFSGGGGTELLPALQQALAMPVREGTSRSLVVITDGFISAEDEAFRLIDRNLGVSNLYAFGIGTSVNRFLIEGLARAGRAESFIVTSEADATQEAERLRQYISAPVLTHITLAGKGVELYDTEPSSHPDLLAQRPVLVLGKYRNARKDASIELSGVTGQGEKHWSFALDGADSDSSLPILWARKRLERLYVFPNASENSHAEILALGLKYSLMSSITSFVAVDEVVSNEGLPAKDVTQPLPLPAGVSDNAVGNELNPAPEPEWLLLATCCALLLGLRALRYRHRSAARG